MFTKWLYFQNNVYQEKTDCGECSSKIILEQKYVTCKNCNSKSGDKSNVSNYKPISVLPILPKIFERTVCNQLYTYLCSRNILWDSQSGFRSNHSTTTILLEVQDYILNNMDKGFATGVIFLDLKKILIKKLPSYGIKDNELDWFKSYSCIRVIGLKLFMLILSYQVFKPIISEFLKAQLWVLCYSLFLLTVCLLL